MTVKFYQVSVQNILKMSSKILELFLNEREGEKVGQS